MKHILAALLLAGSVCQAAPAQTAKEAKPASAELKAIAASLNQAQVSRLLSLVNHGDIPALVALPGIGPARAAAIQAARPFTAPLDLLKVSGIGEATLAAILKHAKANFPPKAAAPPRKKKSSAP
jgi:DNA uptake protein ComE-like DNA-binding protein